MHRSSDEDASMRKFRTVGIRGAGLSGLSVARALLAAHPEISISVFDVRPKLPHPQRTFCFFKPQEIDIYNLPHHSWNRVTFRSNTFNRTLDVSSTPYTMVRGDDFFEHTLCELEASGVNFRWNCQEVSIGSNWIEADSVEEHFECAIDAAFCPSEVSSTMWQSFAGIWISTDNPVFDPTTAILMDLQESSEDAPVSFFYILPTSPHLALIEHTTFSPSPLSEQYHLKRCQSWIHSQIKSQFHIKGLERGIIPMGIVPTQQRKSPLIIGSNGGFVRPATGYSFTTTLRDTTALARTILNGGSPKLCPYPPWLTFGDQIFLRALRKDPLKGGHLLEQLLSRSPARALVSFLSGDVSLYEALSVWLSVPKISMVRSLLRT